LIRDQIWINVGAYDTKSFYMRKFQPNSTRLRETALLRHKTLCIVYMPTMTLLCDAEVLKWFIILVKNLVWKGFMWLILPQNTIKLF